MSKEQIIAAIKALASNAAMSWRDRQRALEDIEFAAQDQREQLEERHEDE